MAASPPASPCERPTVTYFDAEQVTAAFAKGAVLFDGNGANYMVHASRRDAAPARPSPHQGHRHHLRARRVDDLRHRRHHGRRARRRRRTRSAAPSIEGGDTRHLAKGDVIIVPNGTPHWFKEVDGPVLYYVVKVR